MKATVSLKDVINELDVVYGETGLRDYEKEIKR
jgi:hypothetical protein